MEISSIIQKKIEEEILEIGQSETLDEIGRVLYKFEFQLGRQLGDRFREIVNSATQKDFPDYVRIAEMPEEGEKCWKAIVGKNLPQNYKDVWAKEVNKDEIDLGISFDEKEAQKVKDEYTREQFDFFGLNSKAYHSALDLVEKYFEVTPDWSGRGISAPALRNLQIKGYKKETDDSEWNQKVAEFEKIRKLEEELKDVKNFFGLWEAVKIISTLNSAAKIEVKNFPEEDETNWSLNITLNDKSKEFELYPILPLSEIKEWMKNQR